MAERPRNPARSRVLERMREFQSKASSNNRKLVVRYDLDAFISFGHNPHFEPPVAYDDPERRFGGSDFQSLFHEMGFSNTDDDSGDRFREIHIFNPHYAYEINEANAVMYLLRGAMGSGDTFSEFAFSQIFDALAYVSLDGKAANLFMEGCVLDELMLLGF